MGGCGSANICSNYVYVRCAARLLAHFYGRKKVFKQIACVVTIPSPMFDSVTSLRYLDLVNRESHEPVGTSKWSHRFLAFQCNPTVALILYSKFNTSKRARGQLKNLLNLINVQFCRPSSAADSPRRIGTIFKHGCPAEMVKSCD